MIHYRLGLLYKSQGRFGAAIHHIGCATVVSGPDPLYRYELGNCYMAVGEWREAVRCYTSAIEMRPDDGDAHAALVLALRE